MDYTTKQLWERIQKFQLDDPGADFQFSARLARENGWDMPFTERVVVEYKRFLLLCTIAQKPLVPSDAVNQAWCLHLVYTRSYWGELCGEVLGFQLHHYLAKTAPIELLIETYTETQALYQKTFNEFPPATIWPLVQHRFIQVPYRRVNVRKVIMIPKPAFLPANPGWPLVLLGFVMLMVGIYIGSSISHLNLVIMSLGFMAMLLGLFVLSNIIKREVPDI